MRRFMVSIALLATANVVAAWDQYTIRDIGSLPNGNATYANGINRFGHVVGDTYLTYGGINAPSPVYYHQGKLDDVGGLGSAEAINDENNIVGFLDESLTSADYHAFYYEHGRTHDLGTLPGDQDSVAFGINNDNLIVGYSSNEHVHAILYDGVMHSLGALPGDTDSIAAAINNHGQIVGQSYKLVQSGDYGYDPGHAFLYDHGHMYDIGSLPNTNVSAAAGINEAGLIVGSAYYATLTQSGPSHAFLYDGSMHDLGTLGGAQSYATAINKTGVIVGSAEIPGDPSNPQSDAFVYRDGAMHDLNDLINLSKTPWTQLWQANGINESGQITGWGFNDNGLSGFILTPVPVALELLITQLSTVAPAEAALGNIENAKSRYAADDRPGSCALIATALKDLQSAGIDSAEQRELSTETKAIDVAMACP